MQGIRIFKFIRIPTDPSPLHRLLHNKKSNIKGLTFWSLCPVRRRLNTCPRGPRCPTSTNPRGRGSSSPSRPWNAMIVKYTSKNNVLSGFSGVIVSNNITKVFYTTYLIKKHTVLLRDERSRWIRYVICVYIYLIFRSARLDMKWRWYYSTYKKT